MRRLVLALLLLPASLCAQAVNWHGVDTNIHKLAPTLRPASVTPREQKAIVAHLERHGPHEIGDCVVDPELDRRPQFLKAPLGQPGILYVVSACNTSANGELWLVRIVQGQPRTLANFWGWGLEAQPQISHGLHDFVIGSHMSAFETGLDWYRFDGKRYRSISTAVAYSPDEEGGKRMAEARAHCKKCILIRYKQPDTAQ
jgi:hypothetical protein